MRSSLTSSRIRPFIIRSFRNPKSICSQPQSSEKPFSSESPVSENFPGNPIFPESNTFLPTDLSQTTVINSLLSCKNEPISAFEYLKRVEKRRGFLKNLDTFCVLLHILMKYSESHRYARNLLNHYVSGDSEPTSAAIIDHLIESAKRFDFDFDSRVFSYLLNSYVRADRINDAVECCNGMIERDIIPLLQSMNLFLNALVRRNLIDEALFFNALVRRNLIDEAKEFYNKMNLKGLSVDSVTISVMMRARLKEDMTEEAEKYIRDAKAIGVKLDAGQYQQAPSGHYLGNFGIHQNSPSD